MIEIAPLAPERDAAVEDLLDAAFGPERRARTAYTVRGGGSPLRALGFAAIDGDRLVGSIQCWPVVLTDDAGRRWPLVMVGPVAVAPDMQQGGIGRRLTEAALAAATNEGLGEALMLIGDPEYYERFFGFTAARTGQWRLPGPFEPRRLLARGDAVPDVAGMLGPSA
ncbi:putative N-acetyltransferase YhbS [Sphingomonas sp. SORGH_AS802]|uniref:GNAT family N-acetyltransferase n=1 Tax=unclassified Sphingomonas TaxID=196159 RepID=UPI00285E3386|nr:MULTISPECIES: N-acetyltransferase [unclassified Sphingomonas]MDR6125702.1 putative N-acetyltransferase YhbS [Sphingomonas sp. SORGH_AS_0438]MDR6134311.1 putative N-acetyltransferase YhbS [Sphingomonas sp. SORGH_AS_0802]